MNGKYRTSAETVKNMNSDIRQKYEYWKTSLCFDEATRKELEAISDDNEISDRFCKDLTFGTGGLRGILGAGTNRINKYTVTKATQGLAEYIKSKKDTDIFKCEDEEENGKPEERKGIAIAYDSRHMSKELAEETALCLNANGIKTYIFDHLRPTPELSYAVRKLKCRAGIVITASHNPKEYNGYKVYWADGAQITDALAKGITEEIQKVKDIQNIKTTTKEKAEKEGLYNVIGKETDDSYISELKKLVINPEILKQNAGALKIVYTPLHGAGNLPVKRILKELGFNNIYTVKQQEEPDGDFPTVKYPNPEDKGAFELALKLAKEKDADILLATDPDADRLGVYVKDRKTQKYISLTGNMTGLLLAEYILSQRREKKRKNTQSTKNAADTIVTTIVSSKMIREIAKEYKACLIETLTGFKYIGEQIRFFKTEKKQSTKESGEYEYVFGFEESCGYLPGTYARDKDACAAAMLLCEAAAYYAGKNITLTEQMKNIYEKYGYFKEHLISINLPGEEGQEKIRKYMEKKRKEAKEFKEGKTGEICGLKILKIRDYEKEEYIYENALTGESLYEEAKKIPKANVIYYELEKESWICIRPSGTEPKMKVYIGVRGKREDEAEELLDKIAQRYESLDLY